MPLTTYTASVAAVWIVTGLWKRVLSGGWIIFNLFVWLPEKFGYIRKYVYSMLGLGFMIVFAFGFFITLYHLYIVASILLYWSIMFKYGHLPKRIRTIPDPIVRHEETTRHLAQAYLLTDLHLYILPLLYLLHSGDRLLQLDSWRLRFFDEAFAYAYDDESFFLYPFFLFQTSLLMLDTRPAVVISTF